MRPPRCSALNELNRLIDTEQEGKVSEYAYDPAGNRFLKKGPEGELTLYLRHGQIAVAMEVEVAPSSETEYKGKVSRYVLSGDLLAGRITTTVYPDDSTSVAKSWYHLDHLNSTKAVSDESAAVEVRYEYRAFGEQLARLGEGEATYTYSGKELDETTNLYYFNARYYDPAIGRFITLDPVQDGSNWYVYCDNNPLSMVDPTGLQDKEIVQTFNTYLIPSSQIERLMEKNEKDLVESLSPSALQIVASDRIPMPFDDLVIAYAQAAQNKELLDASLRITDLYIKALQVINGAEVDYDQVVFRIEHVAYGEKWPLTGEPNVQSDALIMDAVWSESGKSLLKEPVIAPVAPEVLTNIEETSYKDKAKKQRMESWDPSSGEW